MTPAEEQPLRPELVDAIKAYMRQAKAANTPLPAHLVAGAKSYMAVARAKRTRDAYARASFLLNWIWGIGNNTFIALLTLIPFVGLIMPFVLGAKGSGWAWRNGRWDSLEHFKRVQRLWAIWGAVIWIVAIVLGCGLFGGALYLLGQSEAYQLGISKLKTSSEAADVLGTPISTGTPWGSITYGESDSIPAGESGKAVLNFSATGPKAAGRVFVEAFKKDGVWSLRSLTLKVDGRDAVIDLLKLSKSSSKASAGAFASIAKAVPINSSPMAGGAVTLAMLAAGASG